MKTGIALWSVLWLFCSQSLALDTPPLEPPDRSSPRATLQTFLRSADAVGEFIRMEYRTAPTRAGFIHLRALAETPLKCLDLSQLAPEGRSKSGNAAALMLYEILSRIELPPMEQVPAAEALGSLRGEPIRWVIPHTELTLVRTATGEFVFSAETVARSGDFYSRVRHLPYLRQMPMAGLHDIAVQGGGWMIPYPWVEAMPDAMRDPVFDQPPWKWLMSITFLVILLGLLRFAYRLSRRVSSQRQFLCAVNRLVLPAYVLLAAPCFAYVALLQINLQGGLGSAVQLATAAVTYAAMAWFSWRMAPVVSEAIILSPSIAPQSIDAHLIRICLRLLGLIVAIVLLVAGADRVGVPVYGVIAGLGIGGLAVALAAQPTIENLIGGFSLFADKPIRVGSLCKCGDAMGTVEEIGIRSTRIRGADRTVTTIPNAELAKIPIISLTLRERMLIRAVIGVRYETTPDQLRHLLAKLREMLLGHPKVHHEPARARFIGFGASSLDVEVFAYALTQDMDEFMAIQEDVLLRIIDIVEQSGAAFAFPSQTLYVAQDGPQDHAKREAAEAQVQQWRQQGSLPFPNFSADRMRQIRHTVVFPPPGSPDALGDAGRAAATTQTQQPTP